MSRRAWERKTSWALLPHSSSTIFDAVRLAIFQLFGFTYIIGRGLPSPSLGAVNMIPFTYVSILVCCLAYARASETPEAGSGQQEGIPSRKAEEDVARRELTDAGYVIRYGDALYRYPLRIVPVVRQIQTRDPTETNEIESRDDRRPLFYFTTYEDFNSTDPRRELPTSRPYVEIRKKRETVQEDLPGTQKVNLRKKRTYCGKCGRGGYGGYYVPVTYAVYPVYGGGGGGCNTCGGGHGGHGGGGGGGSFSYSSSSAQSSSGSFGWGKK